MPSQDDNLKQKILERQVQPQAPKAPRSDIPEGAAESLVQNLMEEVKARDAAAIEQDAKRWQYVQMCRRGHIAFFYRENPLGKVVTPKDWCATYKPSYDDPWRDAVVCQECTVWDKGGWPLQEHPAQVEYTPSPSRATVHFSPMERWVYRYPKDKEERRRVVMHRASKVAATAGNYGVPNPDFGEQERRKSKEETTHGR